MNTEQLRTLIRQEIQAYLTIERAQRSISVFPSDEEFNEPSAMSIVSNGIYFIRKKETRTDGTTILYIFNSEDARVKMTASSELVAQLNDSHKYIKLYTRMTTNDAGEEMTEQAFSLF